MGSQQNFSQTPCIEWTGYIDRHGYGRCGRAALAHREEWKKVNGIIPEGLVIDHLCRNRKCVNVNHMEVVTRGENTLRGLATSALNARKTHCLNGHQLAGDNCYIYNERNGKRRRICRKCNAASVKAYKERRKLGRQS